MNINIKSLDNDKEKTTFNKVAVHPIQSWEWGNFRIAQGHKIVRIGYFEDEKLESVYQISFHNIPKTKYTIGHLAQCDLVNKEIVEKLIQIGRENNAIFIKVEPSVILTDERRVEEENTLKSLGLVPGKSIFIRSTSEIDLNKEEEKIFNGFKNKTRYNIRLAEKHGVKVEETEDEISFEKYLKLIMETTKRQGFFAHNENYHRLQWKTLKQGKMNHLLAAFYENQILATFMLFIFNKVLYYPYGASTREHKEVMAPNLLMWEAIKFGKKNGCTKFDLWGDIDTNTLPGNHPYQGFHRFKEGFSPKLVKLIATHDLVLNQTAYKVYNLFDTVRWKVLKLKAKII